MKCLNPVHNRPPRLPITPAILHLLFNTWSAPPVPYTARMLCAACCLGFFAFLRAGKFTYPSMEAYNPSMLSLGDIAVDNQANPKFLLVSLRHSKTDVFGAGFTLYVGDIGNTLCPVAAILSYMAIYKDSHPLSRTDLVAAVRDSLAPLGPEVSWFSRHSFHIGWGQHHSSTCWDLQLSDSDIGALEILSVPGLHSYATAAINCCFQLLLSSL